MAIYLDNAATTSVRAEVVEAMMPYFSKDYGNPSSLHALGKKARQALEAASAAIANGLQADSPESIIWTSGGTEANNLAIKGIATGLQDKGRHIITSSIEHPCVLEACKWLASQGWEITYLPVDKDGYVNPVDLAAAIRPDTVLVSIMHGNNEIGTIQPIAELGQIARSHDVLFHTDAVQTLGKLPIDLSNLPVDLLSASGHKLNGPKGVGFLYANEKARQCLVPLLHGGGQQQNFRSGTENIPGIVGMAAAFALALDSFPQLRRLQEKLIEGILAQAPQAVLNGPRDVMARVPGNVNFSFPPLEGEALVLRFDLAGICVSSGSACHSAQLAGSHVLAAMGASAAQAKSSIRFSMGYDTTEAEIDTVLAALPSILEKAGFFRINSATATI